MIALSWTRIFRMQATIAAETFRFSIYYGAYGDNSSAARAFEKFNDPVGSRKQSVIPPYTDILPRSYFGASLSDDNASCGHLLTTEAFYTKAFTF